MFGTRSGIRHTPPGKSCRSVGIGRDDFTGFAGPERHQTVGLIDDLTALTEPSQNVTLTMPGCRLLAVAAAPSLTQELLESSQLHRFGVMT